MEKLQDTVGKHRLTYDLLSDSRAEADAAFGLAWRAGEKVLGQLKGFGIDIEDASGETHHLLPVPAVFLSGRGRILFEYANPDHTVRLHPKILLAAATALKPS